MVQFSKVLLAIGKVHTQNCISGLGGLMGSTILLPMFRVYVVNISTCLPYVQIKWADHSFCMCALLSCYVNIQNSSFMMNLWHHIMHSWYWENHLYIVLWSFILNEFRIDNKGLQYMQQHLKASSHYNTSSNNLKPPLITIHAATT